MFHLRFLLAQRYVNHNSTIHIPIFIQGAGVADLSLRIEGPCTARTQCTDNGDSTCTVEYTCDEPGEYVADIKYGDTHVPGMHIQHTHKHKHQVHHFKYVLSTKWMHRLCVLAVMVLMQHNVVQMRHCHSTLMLVLV